MVLGKHLADRKISTRLPSPSTGRPETRLADVAPVIRLVKRSSRRRPCSPVISGETADRHMLPEPFPANIRTTPKNPKG